MLWLFRGALFWLVRRIVQVAAEPTCGGLSGREGLVRIAGSSLLVHFESD